MKKRNKNLTIMWTKGSYQQQYITTMRRRKRMMTTTMKKMMMRMMMTVPGASLPNCTHNDLDVPSKKGELAKPQAIEHLVSPNNLTTNHHKFDYHKYDVDLPLYKLDPFTTGAYFNKSVNEKLFTCCKFFQNNQDIDQFMALVFDEIGMNGNRPDNRYKQMTSWGAIRQMIKKGQMTSDSYVLINGTLRQKVSCLFLS